ncbi:MAG: hypothetical protein KGL98_07320 [Gammaproteobacteria bacterium]|nr:hypothetical protein [Gammaproteobacteria bacterium]
MDAPGRGPEVLNIKGHRADKSYPSRQPVSIHRPDRANLNIRFACTRLPSAPAAANTSRFADTHHGYSILAAIRGAERAVCMNDEKNYAVDDTLTDFVAKNRDGKRPEITERTAEYLDAQIAHFRREAVVHDLHVENLKLRNDELRSKQAKFRAQHQHEKLRMVYQAVLSVIAVMLLALIGYALYSAVTDHSVVVNEFEVPPSFVAAGENGTVVASEFLDQLQILKASALSSPDSRSLQGSWINNIQLQIPQAHVSLADIHRTLHLWLGHEIQVNGEVVLQSKQISLTVRGTGFAARSFSGSPADLHNLLENAAEYVYVEAEPAKKL